MLRSYALAPGTLRRFLRRMFWRFQLIVTISFLAFGLYLTWFSRPILWPRVLPIVVIIALAYFFVIFFNYRQQVRLLYSIRYELDGSSIIYRQVGQELRRLMRADIAQAQQRRDGLWIQNVDGTMNLLVPKGLARDGDEDFLQTLDAWVGVERKEEARPASKVGLLFFAVAAALIILIFINNLWVTVPLGVALFILGILLERRLERSQTVAPGTARMYSLAFSFLIFIIIMKSCMLGIGMALIR